MQQINPKTPQKAFHFKETQLIISLGIQTSESSKIIYNIKQLLYELLSLNVSSSLSSNKFDNPSSLFAGAKRNHDDLRRIQSMLKGYLQTLPHINSQDKDYQPHIYSPSYLSKVNENSKSHQNLNTHFTSDNDDEQNVRTDYPLSNSSKNIGEKLSRLAQIDTIKTENIQLKNEIQKLKSKLNQQIQIPSAQKVNKFLTEEKGVEENSEIPDTKRKLQQSKSTIFGACLNLKEVRSRNRGCIEIIKNLRQALGVMD